VFLGQVLALKAMRLQQGNGHREVACASKLRCEGGVGDKAEEKVRWACTGTCGVLKRCFAPAVEAGGSEAGDTFSWSLNLRWC
jgi:hypothetical protein